MEQKQLEERIAHLDKKYRDGNPEVTDKEFDLLVDELKSRYPNSKLLSKPAINSPASRKEKLPVEMHSLEKVKSVEEVFEWVSSLNLNNDVLVTITPKYDGISLLTKSFRCWTRGDGFEGQASDKHFAMMNQENHDPDIYFAGEAIISKQAWSDNFNGKTNPLSKEPYRVPRNTVAGFFNSNEAPRANAFVSYMRFSCNDFVGTDKSHQLIECNRSNNIEVPFVTVQVKQVDKYLLNDLYCLWSENFRIDGLVMDIEFGDLRNMIGFEENRNPKFARAIKFDEWGEQVVSTVTGLTFNVSKQGKIKPVINIVPVEIGGVNVSNITGNNMKFISDNSISEGCNIILTRSGDVIPKYLKNVSFDAVTLMDMFDNLTSCPCCGEVTAWDSTMTEIVCSNPNCPDIKISKLVHFFSIMGFEDFGELSVRQLYSLGYTDVQDYFVLKFETLMEFEGWDVKSSKKLVDQIRSLNKKDIPLARFLHALDLFEGKCGEKDVQLVFDNMSEKEFDMLFEGDNRVISELTKIKGVGDITATSIFNGMQVFVGSNLSSLPVNFFIKSEIKPVESLKMDGMCICVSGFRSDEITSFLQANGGKMSSSVTKETTHLILKDKNSTSSKTKKALSMGIEIMSREEFESKYMNIG